MFRVLAALTMVLVGEASASAATVFVNCDRGRSLNRVLSRLPRQIPFTVKVIGTCTEYVQVRGFDRLTLKGAPGAALVQPSTVPATGLVATLMIEASRSVVVDGFTVQASPTTGSGIIVRGGSGDIRLRNLTVQGGGIGVVVIEHSQASIVQLTGQDPGFATVGVYDTSGVHLEDSLLSHSTGDLWHSGIDVGGGSHVALHGTTIRNMSVGMSASGNSVIDVASFNAFVPFGGPTDVVIDNPLGTNYYGVLVTSGATLSLGNAKLVITNAGQTWGGDTGGVLVTDGGKLEAGANLGVSGSQGQGVFVSNLSTAHFGGSQISGGQHGGLVVVNGSHVTVDSFTPPTEVSGNAVDLFCDSGSVIAGNSAISGATTVQCDNLLAGPYPAVP